MYRRTLLASTSVGFLSGIGGCTGFLEDESTSLVGLGVGNHYHEEREIYVRVEQDGDRVLDENKSVAGSDSEPVDCTWSRDAGGTRIRARLDGESEWKSHDLDDSDAECAFVWVHVIPRTGTLGIATIDDCERSTDCR